MTITSEQTEGRQRIELMKRRHREVEEQAELMEDFREILRNEDCGILFDQTGVTLHGDAGSVSVPFEPSCPQEAFLTGIEAGRALRHREEETGEKAGVDLAEEIEHEIESRILSKA